MPQRPDAVDFESGAPAVHGRKDGGLATQKHFNDTTAEYVVAGVVLGRAVDLPEQMPAREMRAQSSGSDNACVRRAASANRRH